MESVCKSPKISFCDLERWPLPSQWPQWPLEKKLACSQRPRKWGWWWWGDWPLGRSREASPQFTANMHFSRARAQLGLVRSKSLAVTSLNLKKKKKRKKKQQPSQLNGTVARDSPRPESFMSYHEQADASSEETE